MAETTERDAGALSDDILAEVRAEADPGFAERLRGELRGRQARATENLWWFDIDLPVGTIRVVHDEQLVHLVDNDMRRYELRATHELGFNPRHGESKRLRAAAEQVFAGRRRGSDIAFLGELTSFQPCVLRGPRWRTTRYRSSCPATAWSTPTGASASTPPAGRK